MRGVRTPRPAWARRCAAASRWVSACAEPRRTGSRSSALPSTRIWTPPNGSAWRLVSSAASPSSDSSAPTALVRQVLAAWSNGDWAGLQALLAPGYRATSESPSAEGDELRRRFESFHRTWTEARFDIDEQFGVGERTVTRFTATLTEAGTGRTVRHSVLDISRVVDGQLAHHWDSWEEVRLTARGAVE